METTAIIDIGSNTIKMNIYQITDKKFTLIFNEKETFGFLNYIEEGVMSEKGIEKLIELLNTFRRQCESINIKGKNFICYATAGLRSVVNRNEIIERLYKNHNIKIDLLSGEEEARFGFASVMNYFDVSDGLCIDMGGGSTEFLKFKGKKTSDSVSINVGSLYLYKNFVSDILPKPEEIIKITDYTSSQIDRLDFIRGTISNVFLIGGTARSIVKLHKNMIKKSEKVHGYTIEKDSFEQLLDLYKTNRSEMVNSIIKESPDRLHTIIPGLIFYSVIFRNIKCENIKMNEYGLREGYLIEEIINK